MVSVVILTGETLGFYDNRNLITFLLHRLYSSRA